jgi:hypothetical protein
MMIAFSDVINSPRVNNSHEENYTPHRKLIVLYLNLIVHKAEDK